MKWLESWFQRLAVGLLPLCLACSDQDPVSPLPEIAALRDTPVSTDLSRVPFSNRALVLDGAVGRVVRFECSLAARVGDQTAVKRITKSLEVPRGARWNGRSVLIGRRDVDSAGREVTLGFCNVPAMAVAVLRATRELGIRPEDLRGLRMDDLPPSWRDRSQVRQVLGRTSGSDSGGHSMMSTECILYLQFHGCLVYGGGAIVATVSSSGSGYEPMPDEPPFPEGPSEGSGGSGPPVEFPVSTLCDLILQQPGADTCSELPDGQRSLITNLFDLSYQTPQGTVGFLGSDWFCQQMRSATEALIADLTKPVMYGETSPAMISGEMRTPAAFTLISQDGVVVGFFASESLLAASDPRAALLAISHEAYHIWTATGATEAAEASAIKAAQYCTQVISGNPFIQ